MMLEWWAYVLDVVAFYNSEITQEGLLRTARRQASLSATTALIGYTPRCRRSPPTRCWWRSPSRARR